MSSTFELCTMVRDRIIASRNIEIPPSKVFISKPASIFIGEGPVIVIYPMKGVRRTHTGSDNFPDESYYRETISFDVLVDDIYEDAINTSAIETASRIKKAMEEAVFMERPEAVEYLDNLGINVYEYAPGNSGTYQLESQMKSGSMVGMGTEITIETTEKWQKESRDIYVEHQIAIVHGETAERIRIR